MEQEIKVVFVKDSLQEQIIAQQGDTIAIFDRNSRAPKEHERCFYLSTTIKAAAEKLATIPGCKRTPITGNLERFHFTLSKKELVLFLIDNFPALHFNV